VMPSHPALPRPRWATEMHAKKARGEPLEHGRPTAGRSQRSWYSLAGGSVRLRWAGNIKERGSGIATFAIVQPCKVRPRLRAMTSAAIADPWARRHHPLNSMTYQAEHDREHERAADDRSRVREGSGRARISGGRRPRDRSRRGRMVRKLNPGTTERCPQPAS
jgi:hypothetical protein